MDGLVGTLSVTVSLTTWETPALFLTFRTLDLAGILGR
jgi:hypothetical protein